MYSMTGSSSLAGDPSSLLARVSRLEDTAPFSVRGGGFARQGRNQFLPLDSSGVTDGKLNLTTSAGIHFQGIMSPNVVDGQFTVSKPTDSSATLYWDGTNSSRVIVIRRPDGTTSTVPGNNLTITGLTHDVQYQAFAFWAPDNACGIGFSQGTVGTPQIAIASTDADTVASQAQAAASLAGREPLGNISWTQPTSGGTGGAGNPTDPPVRNPGTCVRMGTHIEPLGSYRPSEIEELLHPQEDWIHIESKRGLVLEGTPNHNIYHAQFGKRQMNGFAKGEYAITRFGEDQLIEWYPFKRACTKVQVKMKFGHLFWANGFLSHNAKLATGV